jgi:hypothetical protein
MLYLSIAKKEKGQVCQSVQAEQYLKHLFSFTHQQMHFLLNVKSLKFTLKHLKRSNMFRSFEHLQGGYTVPS